jgi:hypothetical protein
MVRARASASTSTRPQNAGVAGPQASEELGGAYDSIVRPLRYGYEEEEDILLRETDVVGFRTITGMVVWKEFMVSKFVRGARVDHSYVQTSTALDDDKPFDIGRGEAIWKQPALDIVAVDLQRLVAV